MINTYTQSIDSGAKSKVVFWIPALVVENWWWTNDKSTAAGGEPKLINYRFAKESVPIGDKYEK